MPDIEKDYKGDNPHGWGWRGDYFIFSHRGNIVASISKLPPNHEFTEWIGTFMGASQLTSDDFPSVFKFIQTKLIEYGY